MAGPSPNAADVDFQFDLALAAARDLSQLAGIINDKAYAWGSAASGALDGWLGRHRDHFEGNLATAGTDAETISSNLAHLATQFAEQWAAARGEQDRINWARWVQAQKDDDSWGENVIDFFHEEDFGEPPANPPVPSAPDFAPTRAPIHPEYERTGSSV